MRFRKTIIPAAGLGPKFLRASKFQPNGKLPIVENQRQYIAEEEDMIIVTGRGKRAI